MILPHTCFATQPSAKYTELYCLIILKCHRLLCFKRNHLIHLSLSLSLSLTLSSWPLWLIHYMVPLSSLTPYPVKFLRSSLTLAAMCLPGLTWHCLTFPKRADGILLHAQCVFQELRGQMIVETVLFNFYYYPLLIILKQISENYQMVYRCQILFQKLCWDNQENFTEEFCHGHSFETNNCIFHVLWLVCCSTYGDAHTQTHTHRQNLPV